jgi:hypothetical protein
MHVLREIFEGEAEDLRCDAWCPWCDGEAYLRDVERRGEAWCDVTCVRRYIGERVYAVGWGDAGGQGYVERYVEGGFAWEKAPW